MQKRHVTITKEIKEWLDQRGGRGQNDLLANKDGRLYVFMADGYGADEKIYLPESLQVIKEIV